MPNPFIPQNAEPDNQPLDPFLVTSPYSPIPTPGTVEQVFGPVLNIDQLNIAMASQPLSASSIPSIIINTTVQNGTIQLNSGSEAFPSMNFYGDPDNGIYYIGSNHWGLVAGGTKVLDITPSAITHTVPLIPSTATGNTLGDPTHRWDIYARNIDASTTITLGSLTASRLVASDASKNLVSVDASSFISGTTNQIVVTPSSGTVTLSTPQNIDTGASVTFGSLHLTSFLKVDGNVGFFGTSPVSQTGAYTLTYSTVTRTLNAYTPNTQSSVYTGIDNLQVGTVYATVADLNTLRVAYENLRTSYDNEISVLRQALGDLITYGLFH